jgi:hypothetical protein
MASRIPTARLVLRAAVVFGAGVALSFAFEACQAFGGHSGEAVRADVALDAGYLACTAGGVCTPDPGSRPTDCSVADSVETLPIVTFDDLNTQNGYFKAEALYEYTDATASSWFATIDKQGKKLCRASGPGPRPYLPQCPDSEMDAGAPALDSCGYEPWTEPVDLCRPGNNALHLIGGPFLGWGGGMGVSMQKLNGRDPSVTNRDVNKALCLPKPGEALNPVCPPDDSEFAVKVAALDVSHYDGVSFWARRGPKSQAGIRVAVGDKYTDDDLNYYATRREAQTGVAQPRYCERIKECGCLYENPCTYDPRFGQNWCQDPCDTKTQDQCNIGLGTGIAANSNMSSLNGVSANCLCGAHDVCDTIYAAFPNDTPIDKATGLPFKRPDGSTPFGDTAFYGRACTPYKFADGSGTSYCFNPGKDPPPAPGRERCGDHWVKTVTLGPDWQFYRVPFTDLAQQGFAKKAEKLDLHSVSVVRFTWDAGYVEYWIDALSFYKNP